ncbi:helix-turn-helix transcriptional regulator, TetR family [Geotalea daltonii FRC-32]|uniref:Helix-turn-helix transcriptional regulator, TetR family n=1 Tax=Geotalea daltonii (strain DSM 22248 / JCM 15807 / FRC-32) TaxID=316067 RepID=B9M0U2_GEODF|nr:TetR/AcrR family transcriptional regulator [Geotalea daltonii]ACM20945.1 helix-turn-helix transcriptional regulator, TetR family [Geotalea daltonii FRC-32]
MVKKDYRNNLIETATRLFAERGLKGVSIRELSKAAEVSISMISYHFGGKEGLYSLVLQEQFACFEQIETIRELEAAPLEKIEAYIRWSIRRHREYPYLMRFYTSELTNPTPYFATIVDPAIKKVIRILMDTIGEGIRIRHFRQGLSPVDTVLAMVGMVNYYFLSTLATREIVSHSPERDEELIRHYMDLFGKGILT